MANICDNDLFISSDDTNNLEYVKNFMTSKLDADILDEDEEFVDIFFNSKWDFPNEIMDELYKGIPNKEDIYMRCLSTEFGCDYVAFHKCIDDSGWKLIN